MELNKELVKEVRNKLGDSTGQGLLYLLSLKFKLKHNGFDLEVMSTINRMGYASKDHTTGEIIFKVPLFENEKVQSAWDWVEEFRQLFKKKNKARYGNKKSCTERMKKFFSENPDVRVDEVLGATLMYLRSEDPRYCKTSHKFIYEGSGLMKSSMLQDWIEKYREKEERNKVNFNKNKLL